MLKYLLLPLIVAGALLVPTKPAAAYRGYVVRGPGFYARPYYRPRPYFAPRVMVRPIYNRAPVYAMPYNGTGYYGGAYYSGFQPGYYQSYGW